ncbi:MAG: DUF4432 family protein [Treponema sp.]
MRSYLNLSYGDLSKRTGSLAQICYAKQMCFADGPAKGIDCVEIQNGSGLFCHILTGRGMGIGHLNIMGIPVCWISPNEEVAACYYNPNGEGWLESFGGGMLTSCGLTNAGSPTTVEGIGVGLHGRLSHLPARDVSIHKQVIGNDYVISVEGEMIDCRVMGPAFSIKRTYTFVMGKNEILLHDRIMNLGDKDEPLFVLYHLNIGYPFLSEHSDLHITNQVPPIQVKDLKYSDDTPNWNNFTGPGKGVTERVYYHTLEKSNKDSDISLTNEYDDCRLKFSLSFPLNEINHFVEWKMLAEKNYILGLEPGNTFASGRDYSFAHHDVEYLKAGDVKDVHMKLAYSVEMK